MASLCFFGLNARARRGDCRACFMHAVAMVLIILQAAAHAAEGEPVLERCLVSRME